MNNTPATLYVVATPIGNLADITYRAVEVLKQVDLIAAEDTRHSRRLMEHYGIQTRLLAYHEHNEQQQSLVLLEKLQSGLDVALISDAGTPLINDPGYRLLTAVHEVGIKVIPIPGPNAAIAALSVCGLPVNRFAFEGFPPAKSSQRLRYYEQLAASDYTLVFYESSHRIVESLRDAGQAFGSERIAVIARELTKTYETVRQGTLASLLAFVSEDTNQQKGEFVVIISPQPSRSETEDEAEIHHMLQKLLPILSVKQASQVIAVLTGQKKNKVYQMALSLQVDE